ncbi:CRISPR-associated protein Cmr3 [Micromonospora sonchi]|uniref:CRISPR-associated protein Cmr3 n=1 Tax=Micromonospora sonchi TaxID=1763543 RepID=A0A917X500_9ACTN|nr:type III-B CRISPR module-associated Cmr3 family protein [Micromonospora sonchi]GGM66713.1 CRISPR-associated protein Cmr3 [Micromonospora sonchi]
MRRWLALTPRDALLVRDGRQFDAGVDTAAEPTHPRPSTVGGAVFSAYGEEPNEIRGPVLAQWHGGWWTSYFPTPADLVRSADDQSMVTRLRPTESAAITDLGDDLRHLMAGEGDPLEGWLTGDSLGKYLRGELIHSDAPYRSVDDLGLGFVRDDPDIDPGPLVREPRVGLGRTPQRVAQDGLLYQATFLRPVDGVALLAECVLPQNWQRAANGPVALGGRGRLADVAEVEGVAWPDAPREFPDGRVLVYVATPAIWSGGWRIEEPPGARLVTAAVGPPEPIATASPRSEGGVRATRALYWAVPAGSVYLLQFDSADAAAAWALGDGDCAGVHGTAYGRPAKDRLRTAGFGVILTGVWS